MILLPWSRRSTSAGTRPPRRPAKARQGAYDRSRREPVRAGDRQGAGVDRGSAGRGAIRAPSGHWAGLIIVGLIGLIMVVVLWRAGVLRTSQVRRRCRLRQRAVRSAEQYRAEAEQDGRRRRLRAAVRSRFRACVRRARRADHPGRPGRPDRATRWRDATPAVPDLREPLAAGRAARSPRLSTATVRPGRSGTRWSRRTTPPGPCDPGCWCADDQYDRPEPSPAESWRSLRTPVLVTGGCSPRSSS